MTRCDAENAPEGLELSTTGLPLPARLTNEPFPIVCHGPLADPAITAFLQALPGSMAAVVTGPGEVLTLHAEQPYDLSDLGDPAYTYVYIVNRELRTVHSHDFDLARNDINPLRIRMNDGFDCNLVATAALNIADPADFVLLNHGRNMGGDPSPVFEHVFLGVLLQIRKYVIDYISSGYGLHLEALPAFRRALDQASYAFEQVEKETVQGVQVARFVISCTPGENAQSFFGFLRKVQKTIQDTAYPELANFFDWDRVCELVSEPAPNVAVTYTELARRLKQTYFVRGTGEEPDELGFGASVLWFIAGLDEAEYQEYCLDFFCRRIARDQMMEVVRTWRQPPPLR